MTIGNHDNGPAAAARLRRQRPCPICGKASAARYHPFCSSRCADVDLNRWLTGRYAIPGEETGEPPEGAEQQADEPVKPQRRS